jgi:phage-related protein
MAYMTFQEGFFSGIVDNVKRNVNNMVNAGKSAVSHVTGGIQKAANNVSNAANTVSNTMSNVANKFGTKPNNITHEDTGIVSGNNPAPKMYNNPQTKGNNSNLISKIKRQIPNGSFQNRTSTSPLNRKVMK